MPVPTFDIEYYKGYSYDLGFSLTDAQDPPQPLDLTGKRVRFLLDEVNPNELTLNSDDSVATDGGSRLQIDDGPNAHLLLRIGPSDTALANDEYGYYRIDMITIADPTEKVLLFKGTVRALPFSSTGVI